MKTSMVYNADNVDSIKKYAVHCATMAATSFDDIDIDKIISWLNGNDTISGVWCQVKMATLLNGTELPTLSVIWAAVQIKYTDDLSEISGYLDTLNFHFAFVPEQAVPYVVISREEATRQGLTKYFTGTPCKNGHLAPRYVKSGVCTKCQQLRARGISPTLQDDYKPGVIISREEATRQGLTKYFTGTPCVNGHVSPRYVKSGMCCVCQQNRCKKDNKVIKSCRDQYKEMVSNFTPAELEFIKSGLPISREVAITGGFTVYFQDGIWIKIKEG